MSKYSVAELEQAKGRGAQVKVLAKQVEAPSLEATLAELAKMMVEAKADYRDKISAEMDRRHREMLEKVDALVLAVSQQKPQDITKVMRMLAQVKEEHGQLVAMVTEGQCEPPCDYKLTFERDQRGLIDGTKGILFTAITDGER